MPTLQREMVLAKKLAPLKERYDYILLDTAPNFNMVTINALTAADYVLAPVQPEPLCLTGLDQLAETYEMVRSSTNPNLKLLGLFISMYDGRDGVHKLITEQVREKWQGLVFETQIRERSIVHKATLMKRSVIGLYPNSDLAQDYQLFTQEVIGRVEKA